MTYHHNASRRHADLAAELLDAAAEKSREPFGKLPEKSQDAALQGIGYALLALVDQLADTNDTVTDVGGAVTDTAAHLEQLAMTADELASGMKNIRIRRGWRVWRPRPKAGKALAGSFPLSQGSLLPAADGSGASVADLIVARDGQVPQVSVPRYAAPNVSVTRVTTVISPEPATGRMPPGHYQHLLLDTRTGELSFHENGAHLEPWDPSWQAVDDVPRGTWNRWCPGTLFVGRGPHMWFEPVPELLCWVIDSGVAELPYLDARAANALLREVAPHAQSLLIWLFDAGNLDWSADSAHKGRTISRLCSRHPQQTANREAGADLVDYAEIVQRCPQVYRPELLPLPLDRLADECEYITRFLGSNEHWHPEIKKVFGAPYPDGSGVGLDVLGVRAWYQTAAGVIA